MKKILMKIIALSLVLSALAVPTKKAEAGVILMSGGMATLPGVLIIGAGVGTAGFGLLNAAFCGFSESRAGGCFAISGLILLAGVGIVVLDENGNESGYKTIPSYVLQEVDALSRVKAESISADKNGAKDVVFTDSEVDELFSLTDESTDPSELASLRAVLTSSSL